MLRYPHFEPHLPRERWLLPAILEDQAVRRPDSPFLQWTDACPPYSFARTDASGTTGPSRGVVMSHSQVYMVPRYIEIMSQLPQTPSEKVRKHELRAAGVTFSTWDRVRAGARLAKEHPLHASPATASPQSKEKN